MNTELINALQDKFAVVSFRVLPRGAFKWGSSRRGYYRLQTNTVPRAVRINSAQCVSQKNGPSGLETVGSRSAYCLDESQAQLIAEAARRNAAFRQDKWATAFGALASAALDGARDQK